MRAKYYRTEPASRDPEDITDLLGAIIEKAGSGADRPASTLVNEWDHIVPERWRDQSRPVGIRQGVLLVEVPSGAAATLLRHDTASLLSGISQRFGPGVVEAVRVRVAEPRRSSKNP